MKIFMLPLMIILASTGFLWPMFKKMSAASRVVSFGLLAASLIIWAYMYWIDHHVSAFTLLKHWLQPFVPF